MRIRRLKRPTWKAIRSACAGQIGSVLELLQGRLSDHVMDVVTHREAGLFPQPGEIKLACDCPDWATMCKHAAAVLYGVGSRLDDSPELLFRLRGVDEAELIAADVALPPKAASADTLADGDLGGIFGIDLDAGARAPRPKRRPKAGETRRPRASRAGAASRGAAPGFRPTGALIAEMRARSGWSVAEFAGLLRVSGTTVRRWEATPGPLALRRAARDALTVLRREIERHGG